MDNYKDFSEDERIFYLREAGFDSREKELFRLRVYEEKTLAEASEIMGYSTRTVDRINRKLSAAVVFASDMKTLNAAAASSIRYKSIGNGKNIKEDELEDLYRIKVIWAKYKDGYLSEQDERYGKEMPMFIAEDIDRRFPLAVDHNEKGKAENWNYRIIIPCMFAMLKNDHEKILALQADNQELHSKLDALSTEVQELKELINNISRKE